MNKDQQPEEMRSIPDGGLKDAMPGWLKRPPAWRSMPTTEQRRERALPEPDTSEIDPKTLVDISDLPQWLQTIAARGDVPVPEPDLTVEYAVQQIKAVTSMPVGATHEAEAVQSEDPTPDAEEPGHGQPPTAEIGLLTDERGTSDVSQDAIAHSVLWIVGVVMAGMVLITIAVLFFVLL